VRVRPVSFDLLVTELADRLAGDRPGGGRPGDGHLRVAVDGAPAARPADLADALVDPLRVRGRPAVRISAADFLRPASVRLENGRTNPDAFYAGWLDEAALRREVLDPAGPGGSGRIVTRFFDAAADRATREPYTALAAGSVLLVDGPLLLGAGLPFDVTVHLEVSAAALGRRTPEPDRWTLPAYARYDVEVDPSAFADVVVRLDDPRHPALVLDRF
jgi:hypothetical protein